MGKQDDNRFFFIFVYFPYELYIYALAKTVYFAFFPQMYICCFGDS